MKKRDCGGAARLYLQLTTVVNITLLCASCANLGIQRLRYPDAQPDHPWAGNRPAARAIATFEQRADLFRHFLEWRDDSNRPIADSQQIILACEKWLRETNVAPVYSKRETVVVTNPRFADPRPIGGSLPRKVDGYPKVKVIVCISPIVVVVGPGPIEAMTSTSWWSGEGETQVKVLLEHGYHYGREVPFESDAIWFSPDMQIAPGPAQVVDVDTRRISVPWGSLYLRKRNQLWVVTATSENAVQMTDPVQR